MIGDSQIYFTTCLKHNLPNDVFIKPDKSQPNYQKQVCRQCAFEFHDIIPAQLIKDSNQPLIERFESQAKANLIKMNQFIHSIRQLINKQIENLINEIRNQTQIQDNLLKQCRTNILQKEVIEQVHQQYLESQKDFQQASVQQIEIIKQNQAYDQMIKLLEEMNLNSLAYKKRLNIVEIKQLKSQIKKKVISYEYEFLSKSTIKYDQQCEAIAFNRDASIVVAGCNENIKVFEFKNEQFKEIQELKGHSEAITCLQFMKKSNQFISGSFDHQIKIWQYNNNQWINTDTLIEHQKYINCLIINQNEDLIISGSRDKSIIFWRLQTKKWKLNQQIICSGAVRSLSLNNSNTKLISALFDLVEVFEYRISKWYKVQEINFKPPQLQLCFISDSEFLVSDDENQFITFYNFNQTNKQFEIANEFSLNYCLFFKIQDYLPIQFIKSKNLLIIQQYNLLNIYQKLENNEIILNQSINLETEKISEYVSESLDETEKISGCVSDDGQYLLILYPKQNELEAMKLKMIMQ